MFIKENEKLKKEWMVIYYPDPSYLRKEKDLNIVQENLNQLKNFGQ